MSESSMIQTAFPISENANLTAFAAQYLKLKPQLYSNVLLRQKMI